MIYHATTHDITIKVSPNFLDYQSDPDDEQYVWSYHVRMENAGDVTMHLLTRHWEITDAFGKVRRVDGEGVVGAQPILAQNEYFEYQSGCTLKTPSGFMRGHYVFEDEDGNEHDITIPAFPLESPYQTVVLQ
jgi:ApaG protein